MRTWTLRHIGWVVLALFAVGSTVLAQSGGGYDLGWHTVDGGGGGMAGGDYTLKATIGQADAALLTGSEYALVGGFWGADDIAWVLTGRVTLQGQGAQPGTLIQASEFLTATQPDGVFSLRLPPGLHTVTASRPRFLSRQTAVVFGADNLELAPVVLLAGDANEDGQISLFDLVLIAVHYGTNPPGDARADINGDGQVGLLDLVLVASNYGLTSPQPWLPTPAQAEFEAGPVDKRAADWFTVRLPDKVEAGELVEAQVGWQGDGPINGVDVRLRYDPEELTLLAHGEKGQDAAEPGPLFDPTARFIARNHFDPAAGTIQYVVAGLGQMHSVQERGILLTLHFQARVSGQPSLSIETADWLAARRP